MDVTENKTYHGLMHAGAGTGLFLVQLSVIIPGLLPILALPVVALGLVAALLTAPPYALWRLATRSSR